MASPSSCASSGRAPATMLEGLRRPLPWPGAALEAAPCSCEHRRLAFRHPPWLAPLLQQPNADDWCARWLQVTVRPISWRSLFTLLCNGQNPLNPGIERVAWPFQYIRETAPGL